MSQVYETAALVFLKVRYFVICIFENFLQEKLQVAVALHPQFFKGPYVNNF